MATRRPLASQSLSVDERTAEIMLVMPRDAPPAIRVLRERHLADEAGNRLAQIEHYVLGRLIDDNVRAQTIDLDGKPIAVNDIMLALAALCDRWADEDLPIYGEIKYLKPIK